jgi:hypothetical protein
VISKNYVDFLVDINESWSNKDIDWFEDSYGVQYSDDKKRLLCTNMYYKEK